MEPSLVGCFDQPNKSNSWYITSPRIFFAYILFSTTCRAFESGLVAALMGEIKVSSVSSLTCTFGVVCVCALWK